MDEIIIRIVPLPQNIKGATIPDGNGDYNVYIADRLDSDEKARVFRHEIEHIRKRHFQAEGYVDELEAEIK